MINKVKSKIKKGTCEVEDLLQIVSLYSNNDYEVISFIEKMENIEHLQKWIYYIKILYSKGDSCLVELLKKDDDNYNVIIAILASINTEKAANILVELMIHYFKESKEIQLMKVLTEFNLLMSFDGSPKISQSTANKAKEIIYNILNSKLFHTDKDLSLILLALRGVGDLHTIKLIKSKQFVFQEPYDSTINLVIRRINKLHKDKTG